MRRTSSVLRGGRPNGCGDSLRRGIVSLTLRIGREPAPLRALIRQVAGSNPAKALVVLAAAVSVDAQTLEVVEIARAPSSPLHRDEVAEAADAKGSPAEFALERFGRKSEVCGIRFDARNPLHDV
jgi:hypothetical protein